MVKLTVTTGTPGAIQQIIAPTPYLSSGGTRPIEVFPVAPGQVVRLWSPLERSADFWNGRILFDNRPAAVLSAQGGQVEIQMPWDVPVGFRSFRLDVPSGDSPFEQNQGVYVNSAVPVLPLGLAMVLGDFSGLVTTPPSPGDIVHFYMTGLGAVSGSPPLGRPAPADVLFPLQGTLTCLFLPQTTPAQTIFAGLAPGMIGIYQIDFRMPADPNPAPINGIACTLNQAVGQWRFAYCVGQNCGSEIHYP
jgi:uncharacterized protein (TIGR03437 family)